AVEFVQDRDSRQFFAADEKLAYQINSALMARGVISRAMPQGDILGFAPPFCLSHAEADEIAEKLAQSVAEVLG
ncbi:MAG: aspartate aminotransferase family protein, partial [Lutimaribacter sp.]